MSVYHFTDTARLPWILRAGQLQPGRNAIGGFPDPDFVWASSDPRGDRTASAMKGEAALDGYRRGAVRHIRFTLPEDQFFPWREVSTRHPAWTADQVARLQRSAGKVDPATWWCRSEPLPLSQLIAIDWRSYRDNTWRPVPLDRELITRFWPILIVRLGAHHFGSQQFDTARGGQGYSIMNVDILNRGDPMPPGVVAAMAPVEVAR